MNYTTQMPKQSETMLASRYSCEPLWGVSPETARNIVLGALEQGYHEGLTIILTP